MRLVLDEPTADSEQFISQKTNRLNGNVYTEKLEVQKKVLMDQTSLKSAAVITNKFDGSLQIEIKFTARGQQGFAEVTGQNIGDRLAIIIDGQVITAPRINTEISDGIAEITGVFSKQETIELANKINEAIPKRIF